MISCLDSPAYASYESRQDVLVDLVATLLVGFVNSLGTLFRFRLVRGLFRRSFGRLVVGL